MAAVRKNLRRLSTTYIDVKKGKYTAHVVDSIRKREATSTRTTATEAAAAAREKAARG